MFSGIVKKLRSTRGASLSMALMLMLVCLTVASVAIAASTAAVGRQSQLEQSDKSYYNVTSAASVFWDEIKDLNANPFIIIRSCDASTTAEGGLVDDANWSLSFCGSNNAIPNNLSLFQIISYDLIFGRKSQALTESRAAADTSIIQALAKKSIDADTAEPVISTLSESYTPFNVSVQGFNTVIVTVTPKAGSTIEFFFKENGTSATCTLVASVGITNTIYPSENHYEWVSTVVWTPLYMSMGGA